MNTKNIIKHIISALFICSVTTALAQQPDNLNKEVQVTRAYDPIISDANKIDLQIAIDDSLTSVKKEFIYSVLSRGVASTYTIRPIPAATIIEQAYNDPHFFYMRLGAGYPLSPLADIYINNYNSTNLSVGAFYNFRSIFGDIKNDNSKGYDIPIDEMSHNVGVFVKKRFKPLTLGAYANFNYHNVLFYGHDTGINHIMDYKPNKDSISQAYTAINGGFNLTSNNDDPDDFRYHLGVTYNSFSDNGKSKFDIGRMASMSENTIGGELYLGKLFAEKHFFGLNTDFNYYNRKLSTPPNIINDPYDFTENRLRVVVLPYYKFSSDKFELLLGAKFDIAQENDTTKAYIRPHAKFTYYVANEFVPYVSIDGGREINSYEKIARENPYIYPGMNFRMKNSLHEYQIKGGFKGNIQKIVSYNLYAAYSLTKDMYFYKNTDNPIYSGSPLCLYNNFDVVYDEVQGLNAGLEIKAKFSTVEATLKADYYNYNLSELEAPYHRPDFTLKFDTDITIARYFILSARVYAQSKSAYYHYNAQNKTLYNAGFFDIGFGAEYLFTRNFSVFVNANNLLDEKYMIWNLYKVPGIHVEGGITFKF